MFFQPLGTPEVVRHGPRRWALGLPVAVCKMYSRPFLTAWEHFTELLGCVHPDLFSWEPFHLRHPPRLCLAHGRGQKQVTAVRTGLSLLVSMLWPRWNRHPCPVPPPV